MAVAMEVSWRGGVELGRQKKRAWGADAQQLMHLMMGQLQHSQPSAVQSRPESTLDLLGAGAAEPISCLSQSFDLQAHPEELPLPSGWEKFLDLQTGKLYYVNRATGVRSFDDPRKRATSEAEAQVAHEFLGSKRSELETLRASSSSTSSGSPHATSGRDSFASGTRQLWSLQLDDRCASRDAGEASNLELDLNLSFASRPRQGKQQQQAVCTMQMVENALRRSESSPRLRTKVTTKPQRHKHNSISSSFSSLTNSTRSDPGNSPATSSSSSGSSTSSLPGANPRSTGACTEVKTVKVETASSAALVMGACTRCLMFVMLNKGDPRCPRCESKVPLDFASPFKKQRSGGEHRR